MKARPSSRIVIYAKRLAAYAGLLAGFLLLACVILAVPDLVRRAPAPPALARFEAAQSTTAVGAKILDIVQKKKNEPAAAAAKFEPVALDANARLIAADPGLPSSLLEHATYLNDEASSLTRAVIVFRREAPALAFDQTIERYLGLLYAHNRLAVRLTMDWPEAQRRVSPAWETLHERLDKTRQALAEVCQDAYIRHGRWSDLARSCERDQWTRWPEAVYCWRRVGGLEGYWHIIGGAAYVRTRSLKFLNPLRRLLPYAPMPNAAVKN